MQGLSAEAGVSQQLVYEHSATVTALHQALPLHLLEPADEPGQYDRPCALAPCDAIERLSQRDDPVEGERGRASGGHVVARIAAREPRV